MKIFLKSISLSLLFLGSFSVASAAPNIVSQYLTGAGTFAPGQTLTFSAETRNAGTDMNTSNSHRLKVVETLPEVGGVFDYVIKGSYLYTFGYITGNRVHIYNISNPENAVLESTYTVPNSYPSTYVYELEVYGDYLVLGGNNVHLDNEVAILNISNPTNPTFVSSINTSFVSGWSNGVPLYNCQLNDIEGMKVVGSKVYFAGGAANSGGYTENFCVYDISNPASPVFNSDVNNDGFTGPFDVQGNYAYLLISPTSNTTFQGIRIINVSNPSSMTIVGQVSVPYSSAASASHNVKVSGNYLYLGSNGNLGYGDLKIINISNPTAPAIVSELDYNTLNANWTSGAGLSLNYPYLYMTNPSGLVGVNVVDVSNPNSPVMKGHVNGPSGDVTGFNNNYVFGSGYAASSLAVYKPFLRSRFCIDNPNCATSGSSIKTVTINPLAGGVTVATSTTWVATVGTHTITYCSDIIEQYGFDGVSESNESDNCSSYTFVVSPPPITPTGLTATPAACDTGQVNLSWSAVSGATSYQLRNSAGTVIYTGAGTSFAHTGLTAGSAQSYTVRATNAVGSSAYSGSVSATAPSACAVVPTAPTGLTAAPQACGSNQINLSWNAVSSVSGYDLQIDGGVWFNVGNVTSYANTGLAAGSAHTYRVRAWNGVGAGAVSALVNATAPSACASALPNLTTPSLFTPVFGTFDPALGTYGSIQLTFRTENLGGGNTNATADYRLEFDNNGNNTFDALEYNQSRIDAIPTLAVTNGTNEVETISGPIAFGPHRVRITVDSSGNPGKVTETNENDNVYDETLTVPPPNPGLNLTADRTQVRHLETTTIRWSVATPYAGLTCQVDGPNLNLPNINLPSGSNPTAAINAKSEFVLKCTHTSGASWTDSVIVETTGTIEEI